MTQPLFIWAAVEAAALSAVMMAFACSGMAAGETAPQVATSSDRLCTEYSGTPDGPADKPGMVFIAGGSFVMGSDRERPEEQFSHSVKVDGFWIDQHEVTNAQFAKFVEATGYKALVWRGVDPETQRGK